MDEWIEQAFKIIEPFCVKDELHGITNRVGSVSDKEFSQGVSELVVAKYFAERWPNGLLLPRSRKKNAKNIDVSYLFNGQRVNIEIKAPDLSFENENKFTVKAPYQFSDSEQRKMVASQINEHMKGNAKMVPNKISNAKKFLDECRQKFEEAADEGDINIVLFSMDKPFGMDDYRIKLEDEDLLSKYDSIHAVVLSDAAMRHQRDQANLPRGLENSFNYVVRNLRFDSSIINDQLSSVLSCLNHTTDDATAWFKEQLIGKDPLFQFALSPQRLERFNLSRNPTFK